ncbi:MAG: DUF1345 domain-containing protein [Ferruginibacter sp.]
MNETITGKNIFVKMHPLQRIGFSFIFALLIFFLVKNNDLGMLFTIVTTWCVFAFSYIITSWLVMFSRRIAEIKKMAQKDDGSAVFVIVFTIIASFAAMVTVLMLVITSKTDDKNEILRVIVSFSSVMLSWFLVHTIFAFHYAHLFYDTDGANNDNLKKGLDFPNEDDPDYLDFAYFSFVVGMTFQVSDVQVTDKQMRRLVLLHGMLAFILNTFVVALTINFIAGLSK